MLVHGAIEIKSWVRTSQIGHIRSVCLKISFLIPDDSACAVHCAELRIILLVRFRLQHGLRELLRCSITVLGHSCVLIITSTLADCTINGSGMRPTEVNALSFLTLNCRMKNKNKFWVSDSYFVLSIRQYGQMMLLALLWNRDRPKEEVRIFWLLGHGLRPPRRFTGTEVTTQ